MVYEAWILIKDEHRHTAQGALRCEACGRGCGALCSQRRVWPACRPCSWCAGLHGIGPSCRGLLQLRINPTPKKAEAQQGPRGFPCSLTSTHWQKDAHRSQQSGERSCGPLLLPARTRQRPRSGSLFPLCPKVRRTAQGDPSATVWAVPPQLSRGRRELTDDHENPSAGI